ncbi:MAG TPA: LacI family DNA-binding transcriptional regulator [Galbitalea sp.]|nr:LacI family DNA-binding transcriptional regulator [Galbitalea sp.]
MNDVVGVQQSGRNPQRVRQADVARAAGVSQATVSLVLSGSPDLSIGADTRQAVLDAARDLGYVPDPVARRLATGRNNLLGLHTFAPEFPVSLSNSYYPYLEGVEVEAAAQGYDLLLFTGAPSTTSRETAVHRLRLADGCVLVGRHPPIDDVRGLLDSGFPLVYIGRHDDLGGQLSYIGADYSRATAALTDRLYDLGHRSFVYVQELDTAVASTDREAGFEESMRRHSSDSVGRAPRLRAEQITSKLVKDWIEDGCTAIIVEGGTESLESPGSLESLTQALDDLGLEYPRDISLATTGRELTPRSGSIVFAGFDVPRREMGRQAVRLLIDLLGGKEPELAERQRLLECAPVAGNTAGPPREA